MLVHVGHLLLVTALTRSTINMPEFYNPPPMSSCSMLVNSDIFRGRRRDGGCSDDSGEPKQPEQLQRAGVSPHPQ